DHRFPDVLNRAYGGVTDHVDHIGDVLLSLKNGNHCGSRVLSTFLTFDGTHGSLTRESITGFSMSNSRSLSANRAEDFLDDLNWHTLIAEKVLKKGIHLNVDEHRSTNDERN
ncbi:MAG: hypothetical protein JKX97_03205, partial [Candidatus Lindowbacteria bacterium]|nr:hypothetical protein [Candidatus Lindowbacteria bacterium]